MNAIEQIFHENRARGLVLSQATIIEAWANPSSGLSQDFIAHRAGIFEKQIELSAINVLTDDEKQTSQALLYIMKRIGDGRGDVGTAKNILGFTHSIQNTFDAMEAEMSDFGKARAGQSHDRDGLIRLLTERGFECHQSDDGEKDQLTCSKPNTKHYPPHIEIDMVQEWRNGSHVACYEIYSPLLLIYIQALHHRRCG